MDKPAKKLFRCAIYTRKSTEHNLDLEFNSLDAQREACEAYIKSQAHEGWRLIPDHYDDGAFSGASLESLAREETVARDVEAAWEIKRTFGERVSDFVADFGGSWHFIISFFVILRGKGSWSDPLNAESRCDGLLGVRIELNQPHLRLEFTSSCLIGRRHHAARSAPRCPDILRSRELAFGLRTLPRLMLPLSPRSLTLCDGCATACPRSPAEPIGGSAIGLAVDLSFAIGGKRRFRGRL